SHDWRGHGFSDRRERGHIPDHRDARQHGQSTGHFDCHFSHAAVHLRNSGQPINRQRADTTVQRHRNLQRRKHAEHYHQRDLGLGDYIGSHDWRGHGFSDWRERGHIPDHRDARNYRQLARHTNGHCRSAAVHLRNSGQPINRQRADTTVQRHRNLQRRKHAEHYHQCDLGLGDYIGSHDWRGHGFSDWRERGHIPDHRDARNYRQLARHTNGHCRSAAIHLRDSGQPINRQRADTTVQRHRNLQRRKHAKHYHQCDLGLGDYIGSHDWRGHGFSDRRERGHIPDHRDARQHGQSTGHFDCHFSHAAVHLRNSGQPINRQRADTTVQRHRNLQRRKHAEHYHQCDLGLGDYIGSHDWRGHGSSNRRERGHIPDHRDARNYRQLA